MGGAVTLSRLEHFAAHDEAGFKASGVEGAYKVRKKGEMTMMKGNEDHHQHTQIPYTLPLP